MQRRRKETHSISRSVLVVLLSSLAAPGIRRRSRPGGCPGTRNRLGRREMRRDHVVHDDQDDERDQKEKHDDEDKIKLCGRFCCVRNADVAAFVVALSEWGPYERGQRDQETENPTDDAGERRLRLGAHDAGLKRQANGVITLHGDGQDREDRRVRDGELRERHHVAHNLKIQHREYCVSFARPFLLIRFIFSLSSGIYEESEWEKELFSGFSSSSPGFLDMSGPRQCRHVKRYWAASNVIWQTALRWTKKKCI